MNVFEFLPSLMILFRSLFLISPTFLADVVEYDRFCMSVVYVFCLRSSPRIFPPGFHAATSPFPLTGDVV